MYIYKICEAIAVSGATSLLVFQLVLSSDPELPECFNLGRQDHLSCAVFPSRKTYIYIYACMHITSCMHVMHACILLRLD